MQDDEQAIRDLVETWMTATATGDLEQILPLMADDVVFLVPRQVPMRGRDTFATAFHAAMAHVRIEPSSDIREIYISGDLAYCWNHLTVLMTPLSGGTPRRIAGDVLSVLRKQPGGAWVIVRDANLVAPVSDSDNNGS